MFSSLLQPSITSRSYGDGRSGGFSPFSGSPETSRHRVVGQAIDDAVDFPNIRPPRQTTTSYFDRRPNNEQESDDVEEEEERDNDDEDLDEDNVNTPLLPIFSAAHLDRLPLYNIIHSIRLLIVFDRCCACR